MWGITGRSSRVGGQRRAIRSVQVGLARLAVRGPVEHAVLELSGELDFSDAERMIELGMALPHRIVSIDLAGLDFVDAAGARAIDRLRDERTIRHGERPAIIGASRAVERTLRLVRSRSATLVH